MQCRSREFIGQSTYFYVDLRRLPPGTRRACCATRRERHATRRSRCQSINYYHLMGVKWLKSYVAPVIAHVVAAEATYAESLDFGRQLIILKYFTGALRVH